MFCVFRGRNLTSAPELTKSPRTFHSVISVTLCFPAFCHRQVVRATSALIFTLVRVLNRGAWDRQGADRCGRRGRRRRSFRPAGVAGDTQALFDQAGCRAS